MTEPHCRTAYSGGCPGRAGPATPVFETLEQSGVMVPMPGADTPVRSLLLFLDDASRARSLVVRFPAGFSRKESGFYDVGEEIVVLSGHLYVAGLELAAGDWAWLPPGLHRDRLDTTDGATVLAWFSGRNEWRPGSGNQQDRARWAHLGFADAPPAPLRDGKAGDGTGTSAVEAEGTAVRGPAEIFDLTDLRWSLVPLGEMTTVTPGPALVRRPADPSPFDPERSEPR